MKIMMIIDSLVRGGRERRLLELIRALVEYDNIQVSLVLFSKRVEYPEVFDLPVKIHYLERQPAKDPRVFFRFFQICKDEQPMIIHSWGWMPSVYAVPAVSLLNISFVNAAITDAPDRMNWLDNRYFRARLTFPFSDMIVGNSRAGLEVYDAPASKSQCIYNGFDFSRISQLKAAAQVIDQYQIPRGKKIVGMVGAFFDRKDYRTYIQAACQLLDKRQDTIFLAIGDGPLLAEHQQMIPSKHQHNIIFTGMVKEVESLVNIFDIGVLATFTEGISNSIMEYMVLGKAVVSSGGGGVVEIIRHGENGYVTPTSDPIAMAERLGELLDRPELRSQMGKNGRALIHELFSIERMEKEYLKLYKSLLNQKVVATV